MPKTICGLAAGGLALLATPAWADDTQAWGTLAVQAGLGGNWRASSETTLRTSDAKGFYEVESNLLLGYKASKQTTLWIGYTFDPNYSHGSLTTTEHRIRSQAVIENFATIGPVSLSGRLRLETRWRDGLAGTGWRLRPYLKASLPLHGKTKLNLSHESFVDFNTTAFQKVSGWERMRNQISISTPLSKRISIEGGYLEQHGRVLNAAATNDHVATLGLSASF